MCMQLSSTSLLMFLVVSSHLVSLPRVQGEEPVLASQLRERAQPNQLETRVLESKLLLAALLMAQCDGTAALRGGLGWSLILNIETASPRSILLRHTKALSTL